MTRKLLFLLILALAANVQADCVPDREEIGDTGPASSRVCEMLDKRFPEADFKILDREIHSGKSVSLIVLSGSETLSLDYRLVGADWVLEKPRVAGND
jgi:hypothetical protein